MMECLITKILYPHVHHDCKDVASLHSKKQLVVLMCMLHFIEQWKIELELNVCLRVSYKGHSNEWNAIK